jgi:hypothetical protein
LPKSAVTDTSYTSASSNLTGTDTYLSASVITTGISSFPTFTVYVPGTDALI